MDYRLPACCSAMIRRDLIIILNMVVKRPNYEFERCYFSFYLSAMSCYLVDILHQLYYILVLHQSVTITVYSMNFSERLWRDQSCKKAKE